MVDANGIAGLRKQLQQIDAQLNHAHVNEQILSDVTIILNMAIYILNGSAAIRNSNKDSGQT